MHFVDFYRQCFHRQYFCPDCCEARFCSEKCLEESLQSFHRFECLGSTSATAKFMNDFLEKVGSKFRDGHRGDSGE